jgi:hypothetical protein
VIRAGWSTADWRAWFAVHKSWPGQVSRLETLGDLEMVLVAHAEMQREG